MTTKRLVNGRIKSVEQAAEAELVKAKPFLTDTIKRAEHAAWQAALPSALLLLSSTTFSDAKTAASSGIVAAGAAALSLFKSILLQKLKGTSY